MTRFKLNNVDYIRRTNTFAEEYLGLKLNLFQKMLLYIVGVLGAWRKGANNANDSFIYSRMHRR